MQYQITLDAVKTSLRGNIKRWAHRIITKAKIEKYNEIKKDYVFYTLKNNTRLATKLNEKLVSLEIEIGV